MRRALLLLTVIVAPVLVFAAMVMADRTFGASGRGYDYVVQVNLPQGDAASGLPKVEGPLDAGRPLVVIDPGHGGKDPGASANGVQEKDLTLALARALRDELLAGGGVRVALTRDDDTYLLLPERSAIARQLGADLFISIHADSTEGDSPPSGATVYTLSPKGSNDVAEKIAIRENAADRINGVRIAEQSEAVGAILVDLSQRETQARSEQFAQLILRESRGLIPFRERSEQSAAFVVLKTADLPSVLFESGYINNPADQARLASATGRAAFARGVAAAIRVFFARQSAVVPGG